MGKVCTTWLSSWLWNAANQIHRPIEASEYKNYILLFIFIKRLSDVFGNQMEKLVEKIKTGKYRYWRIPDRNGMSLSRENHRIEGVISKVDFNALFLNWKEEKNISKVVDVKEILKSNTTKSTGEEVLALKDAVLLQQKVEEKRAKADKELNKVSKEL